MEGRGGGGGEGGGGEGGEGGEGEGDGDGDGDMGSDDSGSDGDGGDVGSENGGSEDEEREFVRRGKSRAAAGSPAPAPARAAAPRRPVILNPQNAPAAEWSCTLNARDYVDPAVVAMPELRMVRPFVWEGGAPGGELWWARLLRSGASGAVDRFMSLQLICIKGRALWYVFHRWGAVNSKNYGARLTTHASAAEATASFEAVSGAARVRAHPYPSLIHPLNLTCARTPTTLPQAYRHCVGEGADFLAARGSNGARGRAAAPGAKAYVWDDNAIGKGPAGPVYEYAV